jgi:hypothetical protein
MKGVDDGEMAVACLSASAVESLCLLHAVGSDECGIAEVATRLGVSTTVEVMRNALTPLVAAGFLVIEELRVRRTEDGRRWLEDELRKHLAPH